MAEVAIPAGGRNLPQTVSDRLHEWAGVYKAGNLLHQLTVDDFVPVELTIQPRAMLDESHASKNALRAEELNAGEKLAWRLHAGFQTSSSPLPDTR